MWKFYIIEILGNIKDTSFVISIIFGVVLIGVRIFILFSLAEYEYDSTELDSPKKIFKQAFITLIVFSSIFTLTPSKQFMYETYNISTTIEYIQGNEEVKKISDKTLQVINKLNKYLKEEYGKK